MPNASRYQETKAAEEVFATGPRAYLHNRSRPRGRTQHWNLRHAFIWRYIDLLYTPRTTGKPRQLQHSHGALVQSDFARTQKDP